MERRNEVDVLHVKMDVKSAQDFLATVALWRFLSKLR